MIDQTTDMTIEEKIAERELIRAAFHEVSHAAIAKHFGAYPEPSIWRNEDNEERTERAWAGQCGFTNLGAPLTSDQRRLIGMAGIIGEEMAIAKRYEDSEEDSSCENIVNSFFFALEEEEISESDMHYIGKQPTEDHVLLTIELINKYWKEIETDADNLIEQANHVSNKDLRTFFVTTKRESLCEFFGLKIVESNGEDLNDFFGFAKQG